MTKSQVYWWLMLDNVSVVLTVLLVVTCLVGVVGSLVLCISIANQEIDPKNFELLKYWFVIIPIAIAAMLCPDSKQYATIKILPKIANSDFAKQIPADMQSMYDYTNSGT